MTRLKLDLSRSVARSKSCTRFGLVFRAMPILVLHVVLAILTLDGGALHAQTANQVTQEVDTARVKALPNHHPQWANAGNDAGSVAPDKLLDQMTLVLARSPQQQLAFESFLEEQQNPGSPEYHHWLTPSEVGDRFGLSQQDVASVTAWLQSQGLHVNWTSPSRIFIGFGGTAADLSRALQTELHYYTVNGTQRVSVSSDPTIPEALVPAVKAIRGLYTIQERPLHRAVSMQSDSPLMNASGGSHFIVPADFATIYDLPAGVSGSGQSIGIVGRARTNFADFNNFRQKTETNFPNPTEIVPTAFGGVDPGPAYTTPQGTSVDTGDQSEATLDVMRAGSVAPFANLLLVVASVNSKGIDADMQYLVQTSPVPVQVITISFGDCESDAGRSGVAFWDNLFSQAASEGISSFVSSGDSGASGCDVSFQTPPSSPQPNSPNYICSSSYVTCVGGTEFNDTSNPSAYWNSSSGSNLSSALGYIPEGAWNEPLNGSSKPQPASTGGGVSLFIATPSWQTGTGVPAARSGRYTPDISFSASGHDGYFACFAADTGSCVAGSNGTYPFEYFAGTSAAAPAMAGIAALLDQSKGEAQGNLNPELYKLAASTPAAFHDVTVAFSGVGNCNINTPSMCNNSIPSASGLSGGHAGYLVTAGYDEVTGLGSLDVQDFLNSYSAKLVPTVTLTLSATSITVLQALTVAVTVAVGAGNPTPTGSVILTSGSYTSSAITLNNGAATFNIPAGALAPGSDGLIVNYEPDTASSALYTTATSYESYVSVNLLNPTITMTPSSLNVTTAQSLTVTVNIGGGAGNPMPTGTVYLFSGEYSSRATLNLGSATFNIYPGMLAAGSDLLQANFTPDTQVNPTYYGTSASATITVTATAPITPTVIVNQPYFAVAEAGSLPVTVTVSGGTKVTPTGSVTLISGSYTSAPTALVNAEATITIPPESLAVGYDTLTALYAPDAASASTYNNASGSDSFSVFNPVKSTPGITIIPSPSSITPTESLSVWIAVAGNNGYPTTSGSVVLSGGGYTSAAATLGSANSTTITIPAGSLPMGTNILTVSYTPDAESAPVFYSATNTTTVTVGLPGFSITGTSVYVAPGATSGNSSTITVASVLDFTGDVVLSAAITARPTGAQYPPTVSFGSANTVSITNGESASESLTVTTTVPTTATLILPKRPGVPWCAAGGATLACILLFGIPAKRRRWRNLLGTVALLVTFAGGVLSCGGGGGGTGGGGGSSGTTAGIYTITVTGTSGTTTATGIVTLNVQ